MDSPIVVDRTFPGTAAITDVVGGDQALLVRAGTLPQHPGGRSDRDHTARKGVKR